jgi:hypothetical protein
MSRLRARSEGTLRSSRVAAPALLAGPVLLAASVLLAALTLGATPAPGRSPRDSEAIDRLTRESGGGARVSLHRATGMARFVRLEPGSLPVRGRDAGERAADFLRRHGAAFGIRDFDAELVADGRRIDRLGAEHVRYRQVHRGLPVFSGEIRLHFDRRGGLVATNGTFVPEIDIDPAPRRTAAEAEENAIASVRGLRPGPPESPPASPAAQDGAEATLAARGIDLLVFRSGLVQGVPGRDHLAYRVEVVEGATVREFVFVDAHTGKVIDRITGIHDAIHRTIHEPRFNDVVIWNEGAPLPFNSGNASRDVQVNRLIAVSQDVYGFYSNLSGGTFLSWDAADGVLHNVFNIPQTGGVQCPNAFWNGATTNYCDGVTADDVVAHEWTHAYTDSTHGLIYQWQSGALNEAYSDMFGETVDFLNGTGTDAPVPARSPGGCSTFGAPTKPPVVEVFFPPAIAGTYGAGGADFNPAVHRDVIAAVALANDGDTQGGTGTVTDGCQPLVGFPAGRIALIDRGICPFTTKTINAQNAGAGGVLIVNTSDNLASMGGTNPAITIPSGMIRLTDGNRIKAELGEGVTVSMSLDPTTDASYRWLVSEDATAFGGAIRDMWDPTCFSDPGKVSDAQYYVCGTLDNGGVHSNSGIPNHAFALLVDGGTYNGRTVGALGLTRTAHVYWRAMEVYQVPASDFADHADALEQSCADFVGADLADLATGAPSGQALTAADCAQVAAAMLAVEMRQPPTSCNFRPILDPDISPVPCGGVLFADDLETSPAGRWTLSNSGVFPEYLPRDWRWTAGIPAGGSGSAFFALDSVTLGNCTPNDNDQSGVMHLDSPIVTVPVTGAVVTFDHYVATEAGWDGGNIQVSVNDGPFQAIPGTAFRYNPYNATLQPPPAGNTNPLAGQRAFSGTDGGENRGSWGQSQVDLSAFAAAGDRIRLRFSFGVDGCNGLDGWYVDNVSVCLDCSGANGADADGDGRRICDGDCADGDASSYLGAPEVNDGRDNQCGGDAGFGIVDEIDGLLGFFNEADPTEISWPPQDGAATYQVARSETAGFSPTCVTFTTPTASIQDPDSPAVDTSFYYLVRALTPNLGSWGRNSADVEHTLACASPAP